MRRQEDEQYTEHIPNAEYSPHNITNITTKPAQTRIRVIVCSLPSRLAHTPSTLCRCQLISSVLFPVQKVASNRRNGETKLLLQRAFQKR